MGTPVTTDSWRGYNTSAPREPRWMLQTNMVSPHYWLQSGKDTLPVSSSSWRRAPPSPAQHQMEHLMWRQRRRKKSRLYLDRSTWKEAVGMNCVTTCDNRQIPNEL